VADFADSPACGRAPAAAGAALILGGALGNVIDRIRFGAVADFLDLHAAGWHWPAFNVADSAISVGVALLVLAAAVPRKGRKMSETVKEDSLLTLHYRLATGGRHRAGQHLRRQAGHAAAGQRRAGAGAGAQCLIGLPVGERTVFLLEPEQAFGRTTRN
jgi:hypothetical protein